MSENQNQNGEQQPNVAKVMYVVSNDLVRIDDIDCYELLVRDSDIEAKALYISTNKIVLAPKLEIYINSQNLKDKYFLNICEFDEDTCTRLVEKHKECLYKLGDIEILFPYEDVKNLNQFYTGVVMGERKEDPDSFEVKLDNPIIVNSIDRKFTKIFVMSKNLLSGFVVLRLKINPFSLFSVDHSTNYDKPVLFTGFYDKKDILSKDDLWLLKKDKFYTFINNFANYLFTGSVLIVLFLNILVSKNIFVFDTGFALILIIGMGFVIFLHKYKINNDKEYIGDNFTRKYNIESKITNSNIIGTIFGGILLYFILLIYTNHYKYNTDFIYNTDEKVFLDSNSFNVDKSLFLDTDNIIKKIIPVENKYMIDLVYQTPGSLLSFSNRYIDLEVNFEFNKGDFLLGSNLKNVLSDIRNVMQKNISKGLYGELSSMNTYNYRVTMIDIERDIMQLLTAYLDSNKIKSEDIVKNVSITTKYAKLHNVD